MVSEKLFVRIYDLNPLTFPKLSKSSVYPKWMKVVFTVCEVFTFLLSVIFMFHIRTTDINSFVSKLCVGTPILSTTLNLWSVYFLNREKVTYYEDIASFDQTFGKPSTSDCSFRLFMILSFSIIQILSSFIADSFFVFYIITD